MKPTRPLAKLDPQAQRAVCQTVVDTALHAGEISAAHVQRCVDAYQSSDNSTPYFRTSLTGQFEWYTPGPYLGAAKEVIGAIDLDPASCVIAQQTVQAQRFFAISDDGLAHEW
jgi:ParB family chromosome partitioning protein